MINYFTLFFSLILYGVSTTLHKDALRTISIRRMLFLHSHLIFFIYGVIWFFFAKDLRMQLYLFPFLAALCSASGFIFYYEALFDIHVSASFVSLVTSIYALVSVILAIFILKEPFFLLYGIGLFLIILGLILLNSSKKNIITNLKGIVFSFIAMLFWGLWGFFSRLSHVKGAGEVELMGSFALVCMIVFNLYRLRLKKDESNCVKGETKAVLSTIVLAGASFLFYVSIGNFPATFVIPVISGYPLITMISSFIFLKEKFNTLQLISSIIIVLGIIIFFIA